MRKGLGLKDYFYAVKLELEAVSGDGGEALGT